MTLLPPIGVMHEGRLTPFEGQGPMASSEQAHGRSWVLSPAFVNAHSHLEYRLMQGDAPQGSLPAFLRYMGEMKPQEGADQVQEACRLAALENHRTGVWWIWEHSDRPGARAAMDERSLDGLIFQEIITLFDDPWKVLEAANAKGGEHRSIPNPHALYTVDWDVLKTLSSGQTPLSIHAAESQEERDLYVSGTGSMADRRRELGRPLPVPGLTPIERLADAGFLKPGRQAVHVCAIDEGDIRILADTGASAAHCPRSNLYLGCPLAPVRRLLEAGVQAGLGMDSPASGGPIDMFAEMRAALQASAMRGEPLEAEEVWQMACEGGARSVGAPDSAPWIGIRTEGRSVSEILEGAGPADVFWL